MNTDPTSVALPDPSDREAMLDLVAAYAIHAVDEHERGALGIELHGTRSFLRTGRRCRFEVKRP